MTLIIAGHKFEKGFSWDESDKSLEPRGIFVASDSAITTVNGKILLGGFKKVYTIPIRIYLPYFVDSTFHSYKSVFYESNCFVAIAGSTLTAQHVINLITEHLSNLQISYFPPSKTEMKGEYKVLRHCEENPLKEGAGVNVWDENIFYNENLSNIVEGDVFNDVIEHSINKALVSARKYKLDEDSLRQMYTEFASGVYCPRSQSHTLFRYTTANKLNEEGIYEVYARKEEVKPGEIAVLGMRKKFDVKAQQKFDNLISSNTPPAPKMFCYLNQAIDEVKAEQGNEIDRPSVLRYFEQGTVTRADYRSE